MPITEFLYSNAYLLRMVIEISRVFCTLMKLIECTANPFVFYFFNTNDTTWNLAFKITGGKKKKKDCVDKKGNTGKLKTI